MDDDIEIIQYLLCHPRCIELDLSILKRLMDAVKLTDPSTHTSFDELQQLKRSLRILDQIGIRFPCFNYHNLH